MIHDPSNNGTLPESHVALREAGRQQRQADARLIATPIPPLEAGLSAFRHWPLITAVGLVALLIIVLLWPGSVGAAEWRPVAEAVELTTVKASVGYYAVALADGRIAMVLPFSTKAPALQPGPATFYPATMELKSGKATYRVKWIREGR